MNATRTVKPEMAVPMQRLAAALRAARRKGVSLSLSLVHQSPSTPVPTPALAPGVRALAWRDFVAEL
ncbi:MAG: hypothetical protein FJ387_08795 [Verrucomicrobia bacterium]|nr:hypothetical protein [Verrucomicrobiota bacterium]